jgi:hypothetical protein
LVPSATPLDAGSELSAGGDSADNAERFPRALLVDFWPVFEDLVELDTDIGILVKKEKIKKNKNPKKRKYTKTKEYPKKRKRIQSRWK